MTFESEKKMASDDRATAPRVSIIMGSASDYPTMQKAEETPGYALRVVGHADTTGNAAANQRLSHQRASAVTAYLIRELKVPTERILTPAGLGEETLVDEDSGEGGKAQARRVTVFLLVSKASEGTSSIPPSP